MQFDLLTSREVQLVPLDDFIRSPFTIISADKTHMYRILLFPPDLFYIFGKYLFFAYGLFRRRSLFVTHIDLGR